MAAVKVVSQWRCALRSYSHAQLPQRSQISGSLAGFVALIGGSAIKSLPSLPAEAFQQLAPAGCVMGLPRRQAEQHSSALVSDDGHAACKSNPRPIRRTDNRARSRWLLWVNDACSSHWLAMKPLRCRLHATCNAAPPNTTKTFNTSR